MITKEIISEDTRLVWKDEWAEAYEDKNHPEYGIACIVYRLINALEVAEVLSSPNEHIGELFKNAAILSALHAAGVENWEGYDSAVAHFF